MQLTYETETEPIYEIPPQPQPELEVMSMNDECEVPMGNTTVSSDTAGYSVGDNNPFGTYEHDTNGVTYVLNTNTKKIQSASIRMLAFIYQKNFKKGELKNGKNDSNCRKLRMGSRYGQR